MNNPMLMQLNPVMNILKNSGNPMMVLNQMAGNNPAIKQAMNYINANGGDARTAFYKLAQEKGVDPNTILNSFK